MKITTAPISCIVLTMLNTWCMVYDVLAITTIVPLLVFRWGSNNLLLYLYKFIHCQWRIQDLKEGGARLVVCKVRAQKFVAMPPIR